MTTMSFPPMVTLQDPSTHIHTDQTTTTHTHTTSTLQRPFRSSSFRALPAREKATNLTEPEPVDPCAKKIGELRKYLQELTRRSYLQSIYYEGSIPKGRIQSMASSDFDLHLTFDTAASTVKLIFGGKEGTFSLHTPASTMLAFMREHDPKIPSEIYSPRDPSPLSKSPRSLFSPNKNLFTSKTQELHAALRLYTAKDYGLQLDLTRSIFKATASLPNTEELPTVFSCDSRKEKPVLRIRLPSQMEKSFPLKGQLQEMLKFVHLAPLTTPEYIAEQLACSLGHHSLDTCDKFVTDSQPIYFKLKYTPGQPDRIILTTAVKSPRDNASFIYFPPHIIHLLKDQAALPLADIARLVHEHLLFISKKDVTTTISAANETNYKKTINNYHLAYTLTQYQNRPSTLILTTGIKLTSEDTQYIYFPSQIITIQQEQISIKPQYNSNSNPAALSNMPFSYSLLKWRQKVLLTRVIDNYLHLALQDHLNKTISAENLYEPTKMAALEFERFKYNILGMQDTVRAQISRVCPQLTFKPTEIQKENSLTLEIQNAKTQLGYLEFQCVQKKDQPSQQFLAFAGLEQKEGQWVAKSPFILGPAFNAGDLEYIFGFNLPLMIGALGSPLERNLLIWLGFPQDGESKKLRFATLEQKFPQYQVCVGSSKTPYVYELKETTITALGYVIKIFDQECLLTSFFIFAEGNRLTFVDSKFTTKFGNINSSFALYSLIEDKCLAYLNETISAENLYEPAEMVAHEFETFKNNILELQDTVRAQISTVCPQLTFKPTEVQKENSLTLEIQNAKTQLGYLEFQCVQKKDQPSQQFLAFAGLEQKEGQWVAKSPFILGPAFNAGDLEYIFGFNLPFMIGALGSPLERNLLTWLGVPHGDELKKLPLATLEQEFPQYQVCVSPSKIPYVYELKETTITALGYLIKIFDQECSLTSFFIFAEGNQITFVDSNFATTFGNINSSLTLYSLVEDKCLTYLKTSNVNTLQES